MPKPFDAATKELLETDPGAWLELISGRQFGDVRILNVDLSTVTAEADSVLSVNDNLPWLVHLEFQSGYDPDLPLRLLRYNVLVNYRHRQPVQSVALLLCPGADGPALTGLLQQALPDGFLYHEFRYNVVRTLGASGRRNPQGRTGDSSLGSSWESAPGRSARGDPVDPPAA